MTDILKFFPYPVPRPQQVEILKQVQENWASKKYFLISAPVGVGKSGIANAIARWCDGAYVLTETKMLADQYEGEFPEHVGVLKGKANYQCNVNNAFTVETSVCNVMPMSQQQCKDENTCAYFNARNKAQFSKMFMTNYDYFMHVFGTRKDVRPEEWRRAIICDEGHCLEDKISNFCTIQIDVGILREKYDVNVDYVPDEDITQYVLEHCYLQIKRKIDQIQAEVAIGSDNAKKMAVYLQNLSPALAKQLKSKLAAQKYLNRISESIKFYETYSDKEWVIQRTSDTLVSISPLFSETLFQRIFGHVADKIVIMSSTLGSKDAMCREFGLDDEETVFISVDSPFDPEKAPIYPSNSFNLNKEKLESNLPALLGTIDDILEGYSQSKGIIHTGNYKVNEYVLLNSRFKHRLIGTISGTGENERLYQEHIVSKEPTVLVSPSMHTGVDLKGDLSHFQIVAKLPFANMGDKKVRRKMEINPLWYSDDMWKKVIQSCGRSIRSESDQAETYILDGAFATQYKRFKKHLPNWFRRRIKFD